MASGGLRGGQYKVLSNDDVYSVHLATLEVLEKTGVTIKDEAALNLLDEAGAIVSHSTGRAWIPQHIVKEAIRKAPSSVKLCARDPNYDVRLEDRRVYLGTGGTALYVLDLDTGEKREATAEDIKKTAMLSNVLENIHFYLIPTYPHDVPREIAGRVRFYMGLRHSLKHVLGGTYTREGALDAIRMASVIAGGENELRKRPLISIITCVTCPLMWDATYAQIMMESAKHWVPVIISSEPLAGGMGPATLAGTLVQQNAEALSGVVLAQLTNPGTPVIYGTVASILEPKLGSYVSGAVEMGLLSAAAAQLAQHYELPIYATAGMSDSKIPDIQAGYEKAITALMVALSGANLIHDAAGLLEFALTYSYEQMMIDEEIIGMVMRGIRGIEVNDETLAVDVINKVGPGGNFLAQKHTLEHVKTEYFMPQISDRRRREDWEKMGSKDAWQRARELTKRTLAAAEPVPLPEHIEGELRKIMEEAKQEVLKGRPRGG